MTKIRKTPTNVIRVKTRIRRREIARKRRPSVVLVEVYARVMDPLVHDTVRPMGVTLSDGKRFRVPFHEHMSRDAAIDEMVNALKAYTDDVQGFLSKLPGYI